MKDSLKRIIGAAGIITLLLDIIALIIFSILDIDYLAITTMIIAFILIAGLWVLMWDEMKH